MDALKSIIMSPRSTKVSSTPDAVLKSASTVDDPLNGQDFSHHKQVDGLIHNELRGDATRCKVPNLLEHIFPDHALPVSVGEVYDALTAGPSPLYSAASGRWQGPNFLEAHQEVAVAELLESIAGTARRIWHENNEHAEPADKRPEPEYRRWSADFRHCSLPDATLGMDRKPDIVGLALPTVSWKSVRADVQIKCNAKLEGQIVEQLHDGALNVLSVQDTRHFHIGCGIGGESVWINYYDRSGCLRSRTANVHDEPLFFLRIVIGLSLADKIYLGYDPMVEEEIAGNRFVFVEGVKYQYVKTICHRPCIRGLATVCWLCRKVATGKHVVIKNSWKDRSRIYTEADLLRKARQAKVTGIPTVLGFEFVQHGGVRVSTAHIRQALLPKIQHTDTRELTRLVMTEYYDPLESYTSPSDFLSIVRDSVQTHKSLYDDAKILHADICDKNIVAYTDDSGKRRGALIDLNYAIDIEQERETASTGLKSAQTFFISAELLTDGQFIRHEYYHDLDSFLLVIIWVAMVYEGAEAKPRKFNVLESVAGDWMDKNKSKAGSYKQTVMGRKRPNADTFGNFLNNIIDPYFEKLKPCICDLREALYLRDSPTDHAGFIDILTKHINALDGSKASLSDDEEL
ncbi:hypothetical protein BD626DRAFT_435231, partial [Schizophyllum amplum]